jgi:acetylornithine deacetylase/succinyl-diaminopimelate desuccinylase-like protein
MKKRMLFAALAVAGAMNFEAPSALAENNTLSKAVAAARQFRQANEFKILSEFRELLRFPNNARKVEDMRKNATHIRQMMALRGIKTELLEIDGAPPAIYGERIQPGARLTLMMYIHYDGQPTDLSRWKSDPFEPVVRGGRLEDGAQVIDFDSLKDQTIDPDWRLYARSASDDKAPIAVMLAALDALDAAEITPSVNLKFFLDGEEERGSPNLDATIRKYKDKLGSDFWLFLDGPQDQRGNARVVLGVRGITGLDLTVYGPASGLHSGHYGNFSPNAIDRLARLLASMRDATGKVLIDGFYDAVEPPDAATMSLVEAIPNADAEIMRKIEVAGRESPDQRYEETILWPALNFRGIRSGGVGAAGRNVIEPSATAAIGVRMVPIQTLEGVRRVIEAHIRGRGYHIVDEEPDADTRLKHEKIALLDWREAGYPAVRTSPENPYAQRVIELMQAMTNNETFVYPILGGSLPLAHITSNLEVPLVLLPIANQDNSQHAPNENIRIGHLWRGIEIYAGILAAFDVD